MQMPKNTGIKWLFLGLPFGFALGFGVPAIADQAFGKTAEIKVVCESLVGPQGPAGKDGTNGTNGRDGRNTEINFTHVPALEGLFHEQNVQIELQPIG
tara:strand:- start:287 stop:580 length:294 start_codon:yes stop_codon:yes gene_type:complete